MEYVLCSSATTNFMFYINFIIWILQNLKNKSFFLIPIQRLDVARQSRTVIQNVLPIFIYTPCPSMKLYFQVERTIRLSRMLINYDKQSCLTQNFLGLLKAVKRSRHSIFTMVMFIWFSGLNWSFHSSPPPRHNKRYKNMGIILLV